MDQSQDFLRDLATIRAAMAGVARRRLRGDQADEWKQAAWLMLLDRAAIINAQFRGESSLRTFLGSVLDHHCIDWLRASSRSPLANTLTLDRATGPVNLVSARGFVDPAISAEEVRTSEARLARLNDAWTSLSEAERDLITKYWLEGRTMRDIAAALGCGVPAAHQRLHRALAKLRALMTTGARPPARRRDEADGPVRMPPALATADAGSSGLKPLV